MMLPCDPSFVKKKSKGRGWLRAEWLRYLSVSFKGESEEGNGRLFLVSALPLPLSSPTAESTQRPSVIYYEFHLISCFFFAHQFFAKSSVTFKHINAACCCYCGVVGWFLPSFPFDRYQGHTLCRQLRHAQQHRGLCPPHWAHWTRWSHWHLILLLHT